MIEKSFKRKGIFFSLTALLVLFLIYFTIVSQQGLKETQKMDLITDRFHITQELVNAIEDRYVERMVITSGHRTLQGVVLYTNNTTAFLNDFNAFFSEVMLEGETNTGYEGEGAVQANATLEEFMENATLLRLLEDFGNVTNSTKKIQVNFAVAGARVFQNNDTGPWRLGLEVNYSYELLAGFASWNRTNLSLVTSISILDYEDPVFYVSTDGAVSKTIRTEHVEQYSELETNRTLKNGTYRYEEIAPNFISRFENRTTPSSCCGMESLVNLNRIGSGYLRRASFVDYCYFSDMCITIPYGGTDIWTVQGVTSTATTGNYYAFALDNYHISRYKVVRDSVCECVDNQYTGLGCVGIAAENSC